MQKIILFAIVLLLSVTLADDSMSFNAFTGFASVADANAEMCYGVMIDAGSSGSRVYVYKWPCRNVTTIPEVDISQATLNTRNTKPLSSYAANPTNVADGLSDLITFANNNIPSAKKSVTPLYLRATAGMRLLSQGDQDAILRETRKYFNSTGYHFASDAWARVITGSEEGALGWVAVNYLAKKLGKTIPASQTAVAVDVGGASCQITFVPATTITQNLMSLDVAGVQKYNVYTYSFLGWGNDQARNDAIAKSMKIDGVYQCPCFYLGYQRNETINNVMSLVNGTGNPDQCLELIRQGFNMTGCEGTNTCTINKVYLPALPVGMPIFGFSSLSNAASFLGLPTTASPNQLRTRARELCMRTWANASATYTDTFLWSNCFLSLYSAELMQVAFKVGGDTMFDTTGKLSGISVTWALGAILYDISALPCKFDTPGCEAPQPVTSPQPGKSMMPGAGFSIQASGAPQLLALVLIVLLSLFIQRQH